MAIKFTTPNIWTTKIFKPIETFKPRDTSLLGKWWMTTDHVSLYLILTIIGLGIFLSFAASPAVAERLHLDTFYFVKRHIVMIFPCLLTMILISMCSPIGIRRLSLFIYIISLSLLIYTFFNGIEIKGAKRWIVIAGNSLQPSEFIKPALSVITAWFLSEKVQAINFPGVSLSFLFLSLSVGLLIIQPDLGMCVVLVLTLGGQLFIAGLPIIWLLVALIGGSLGLTVAYFLLPHVTKRIDQFLDPISGSQLQELYQITKSLSAFANGGFFGKGPGEGIIKKSVPDAHADFVFAVAGEEFGFILCFIILILFLCLFLRFLFKCFHENNLFIMLAASGLCLQFGLQTFINLASSLHLIPTKGMTLPFMSYGGSSMLAISITAGMILALTRTRHGRYADLLN